MSGIPTLVMVDGNTGATITLKGRGIPTSDPDGAKFPWVPPTFEQVIAAGGGKLINKDNTETTWNDVKNGVVGLYFSAHWVSPANALVPSGL